MITEELARVLLTVLVGTAGGLCGFWLKVPAGGIIGSMLAVSVLQVSGAPLAQLGSGFRFAAQILIGAMLASTLTPAVLVQMFRLAGPIAIAVVALIVFGVLGGWMLHLVTGIPLASALFAGAPGGVAEMALAAGDLGGDPELVATLQMGRLLSVVIFVPAVLRWALRRAPRG